MLKVIYTESGQHLEIAAETVQTWMVVQRRLAHHVGREFYTEKGRASILLPRCAVLMNCLDRWCSDHRSCVVDWAIADDDYVEVTLIGYWTFSVATLVQPTSTLHHCADAGMGDNCTPLIHEGIMVIEMDNDLAEQLLAHWQIAQPSPVSPSLRGRSH